MNTLATLNPLLTAIANQFLRDPKGFVATRIMPPFPTALQAANYYVFGPEELADTATLNPRAPGSSYPRIVQTLSNDTYFCANYGLEGLVPDEERQKYASFFDVDVSRVRKIVDTLKVNQEQRVATLVNNPANVASAAIAVKWSDPASNPKADFDAAAEYIRLQSGMSVNLMVINNPTFLTLIRHPALLDVFKFTTPGLLNEDKLASYFGLPMGGVVIAKTVQATNLEGQTFSPSDIWGNNVLLAHTEDGDLELPNFGRIFYWTAFTSMVNEKTGGTGPGMLAGGAGGPDLLQVMDYRDETKKSDVHRSEHYVGEKIVAKNAGFLLQGAIMLAITAILAVFAMPAQAQFGNGGLTTYQPNYLTIPTNITVSGVFTNATSFSLTNGQYLAVTSGGTDVIRQNTGESIFASVTTTNAAATSATLYFDVTADGTNYTTFHPFALTIPTPGVGTFIGWSNYSTLVMNNVRNVKFTAATNAAVGTGNTNTATVNWLQFSRSVQKQY